MDNPNVTVFLLSHIITHNSKVSFLFKDPNNEYFYKIWFNRTGEWMAGYTTTHRTYYSLSDYDEMKYFDTLTESINWCADHFQTRK